jgi:hypothetical protein
MCPRCGYEPDEPSWIALAHALADAELCRACRRDDEIEEDREGEDAQEEE